MDELVEHAIREPSTEDPRHYRQRVRRLALAYAALFAGSLLGITLLIWQAQLYVNLSQRSNVETLTLAFFLLFFAYTTLLSARGALGAGRIAYFALRARLDADPIEGERRKTQALGPPGGAPATVALNVILEQEGRPRAPFALEVADRAGSMGAVEIDGVRITHRDSLQDGSNSLLAFFVQQVGNVLQERSAPAHLDIVEWKKIDDEETEQYLGLVRFARNLEKRLDCEELWPKRTLSAADCAEIERRLSAVCPALRNEAFLPDWEYAGEHKIPLIPEPLGLISLSRTEKRVDPVASMGCAVVIVIAIVAVLILIVLFPPWVPGS